MSIDPTVLHVVKWYPHPQDVQNGIFVKKHIACVGPNPKVLGLLNFAGRPILEGDVQLYGAKSMSTAAKIGVFTAAIKKYKPDLVHFHCYAPDLTPMLVYAKMMGIRTLHTEHGSSFLIENQGSLKGWKRPLAKWYFNNIHAVNAVSAPLTVGLKALSGKEIQLLPNVVDPFPISSIEKRPVTSYIVAADVVFSIKRQDLILEAFSKLPSSQAELHFIGGGPDLETLKTLCRPHLNVYVHGRMSNEEVLAVLPSYHVLILFSAYETFGITVFEARLSGLHVLCRPNFGGAPFYDAHCQLVNSEEDLIAAMQQCLELESVPRGHFPELNAEHIRKTLIKFYHQLFD
jgi:glycosyltransferase involved in cell wall biosynthesis